VRGKSLDTFCPVRPALVPASDVRTRSLGIRAILNGEVMQDSTTASMVFGVAEIIALSAGDHARASDLIATGTPAESASFAIPGAAGPGDGSRSRSAASAR
jgi:2-keto-4-pentenoate hydratase/2-oxohepta-3-ene-1,7-dioic acid hydratase in catechol pathway